MPAEFDDRHPFESPAADEDTSLGGATHRYSLPGKGGQWVGFALIPALIVFAIIAMPILFGKTYLFSDLGMFHLPIRAFYADCLKRGESFAWMPSILSGCYIHAEGQAGMCHPLHWLLYRWLPLTLAFHCETIISYPFLYAGMTLFLRRWRIPYFAVFFGAFTFTFSGFLLLHGMHVNMIAVLAHLPWLLWTIDLVLRAPSRKTALRAGTGLALLVASQILLGYPQAMYWSALAAAAYVVMLLPGMAFKQAVVRLAYLSIALSVAIGLGAAQLLPTFDLWAGSDRSEPPLSFRYAYSLHPYNLFQLVGPYFYKGHTAFNPRDAKYLHEYVLYNGAAATLFLSWMLIRPRKDRLTWALPVLAVIAVLLSLGRYGHFYVFLVDLPIVKSFRCPVRHAVLFQFASAIAAAITVADLARIARHRQPMSWSRLWVLGVPVLLGWLVTLFLWVARAIGNAWFAKAIVPGADIYISPLLLTLAALLMVTAARGRWIALVALMLMNMTDLAVYGLTYFWISTPNTVANMVEQIDVPRSNDDTRVLVPTDNRMMLKGFDNAGGYLGGYPRTELKYDDDHEHALRAANVGWVLEARGIADRQMRWRKIKQTCLKAYLASRAFSSRDPLEDIENVDLNATALVSESIVLDGGVPGDVTWLERAPGRLRVHATAPGLRLLVISEKYHPGWQATVDGSSQPILRANGDFMGCLVELGEHDVALRFDPASLRWGKRVSLISAGILAAWLILMRGIASPPIAS